MRGLLWITLAFQVISIGVIVTACCHMELFYPNQATFGIILEYSVPPVALAALAYTCQHSAPKMIVALLFSALLLLSIYEALIPSWNHPKFPLLFLGIAYGELSFWLILVFCAVHVFESFYRRRAKG
jgi:hypothetical protein